MKDGKLVIVDAKDAAKDDSDQYKSEKADKDEDNDKKAEDDK